MSDWRAALLADLEALAHDFGRLFLSDCGCVARVERTYWPSRYTEVRRCYGAQEPAGRWEIREIGSGLEVEPRPVTNFGDAQAAEVFYDLSGQPVVNSVGESLILAPGWHESNHVWLAGAGSRRASETIQRANGLVGKYASPILAAVLPDNRRGQLSSGGLVWPSIVNLIADAADRSVLPRTEWLVPAGNQSYSLAVWRRRDECGLGGRLVAPEIVEAIGDEPESVYSDRQAFLRDSELTLYWLVEQLKAAMEPTEPEAEEVPQVVVDGLSDDGRTLVWGGESYPIGPTAIGVMRLLVDAYASGKPYLSQCYLMCEGECETEMRTLVRNNGLADVLARQNRLDGKSAKGMWGLINPAEIKKKASTR